MLLITASCTSGDGAESTGQDASDTPTAADQTWPPVAGSELPADTAVDTSGPRDSTCPYIDGPTVETHTGQRWTGTSLDSRFDTPSCIFWSYEDDPQAVVQVRHMTTHREAVEVVDWAAPVDSTTKALEPEGWSGGRGGSSDSEYGVPGGGAVYSVYRENVAVTVTTAQDQSVKAQQIASETIASLGLCHTDTSV